MPTRNLSLLRSLFIVAAVYALIGRLSFLFLFSPGSAAAIWPAAGIGVAACLLYGYRAGFAILAGAILAIIGTSLPLGAILLIAAGNTLEALLTAWLIKRHIQISNRFHSSRDVFKFVLYTLSGCLLGSTIGPTALLAASNVEGHQYFPLWLTWFLSDVTGITIVTPLILTWNSHPWHTWEKAKQLELLWFGLSFFLCGALVFLISPAPIFFLVQPFILWLAFRFTQAELAKANAVLAAIAVGSTLAGTGPLSTQLLDSPLLLLQTYVSVIGMTGLMLAAAVDGRSRAATALIRMQNDLELKVQSRTAELRGVADSLRHDITIREQVQLALQAREKQLEEAQQLAHLGSWEWDVKSDRMTMSAEMQRIYGIEPDRNFALSYKEYLSYIPAEECALVDRVVTAALTTRLQFSYEHHVRRPDGAIRYLQCSGKIDTDDNDQVVRLYGTAHDITEARELEKSLEETEELYRKLVELLPNAIYLLHRGHIAYSNDAGLKLVGAAHIEQLQKQSFLDFIDPLNRGEIGATLDRLHTGENPVSTEGRIIRIDGKMGDIALAATPIMISGEQDILLMANDISERKKAEQQIRHMARHDPLTGLANRILFRERLEHALTQMQRSGKPVFVLFIDLDRFKAINDTAGHDAGDAVLRECAQRLYSCLRDSDTVARAGGDEFLILIESGSETQDVPAVANKILDAMHHPFEVAGKEFAIGASIGISVAPEDGKDVETLIKHADIAMYRAKTDGKGHFRYYSAMMARQSMERYAMESALRHAIERGEMELHFQPKIELSNRRMSGAEALIRWNHPQLGMLPPSHFIPLAEDIGLIGEMGMWAITEVCHCCRDWQRHGLPPVRIAVNLAYSQFTDEYFFDRIEKLLSDTGLQPDILELEITESMVMQNAERLMGTLQQFKRLGVHLSVDDFGTGYSSLAYLKRLPVDSVKVDRSFIQDLPADAEDVAITRAVLALVHSLKRSVVAEGVETREQLRFLVENGCDQVQGFYFSPPLPPAEFRQLLAEEKSFAL